MTTSELARSVLIFEDDVIFRTRLARAFTDRGFEVRQAEDGNAALQMARQETPEYVVVDLRMPGISGLDVVRELKLLDPTTVVVVLTGYGSIATAIEAIRLGARHYLTKPANVDDILSAFEREEGPTNPSAAFEHPAEDGRKAASCSSAAHVPSLARVEWEHINRVLVDCDGNISKAARLLGLHRRSLQRKLAKHPTPR